MGQLDELLRDGAGAFHIGTRLEIVQRGAGDADEVEAGMRIKPRVLGGEKGVSDMIGQRVEPDGNAVFVQIETRNDSPVTVGDEQRLFAGIDLFKVQHVPRVLRKQPDGAEQQRRKDQRQDSAKKTPTAASAVETFIGSDGFLLAHTESMPRKRRAYARGSRKRRTRLTYAFSES